MRHLFYPAVLERGEGNVYAVWFPDFPGVVAAGTSQEDTMANAEVCPGAGGGGIGRAGQGHARRLLLGRF